MLVQPQNRLFPWYNHSGTEWVKLFVMFFLNVCGTTCGSCQCIIWLRQITLPQLQLCKMAISDTDADWYDRTIDICLWIEHNH